jgi:hypothetical protein
MVALFHGPRGRAAEFSRRRIEFSPRFVSKSYSDPNGMETEASILHPLQRSIVHRRAIRAGCCEGRDLCISDVAADPAEASSFQQRWESRFASPELSKLFARYSANPQGYSRSLPRASCPSSANWTEIAKAFKIGRASVYRVLEAG